ncbi:MAG: transmembrane anchor protein [Paracoccaceae bacterium]
MYNTDMPNRAELPTTGQLLKSTAIALVAALILLVTIVLPSEYSVDPTGIGRKLGLTQMGEIKKQLSEEAAADRAKDRQQPPAPDTRSGLIGRIFAELLVGTAVAQAAPATRTDETVIVLKPAEGAEYKIELSKGRVIQFSWKVEAGIINYDMHGSPAGGGKEQSYRTARGVGSDQGDLTAGFDGSHGWFFRNRGSAPVTIRLTTTGAYTAIKQM